MNLKTIRLYYWTTFGLTVVILPMNIGLGLFALAIVILPILLFHLAIGFSLSKIVHHKKSIILSATNLLIFALVRPDGVHAFTDTGLSSVLDIFGLNFELIGEYQDYFFIGSLALLLVQAVMDIRLRSLVKAAK